MRNRLALVFSGGGARGALQVGALRALLEYGYYPDILVGTSIGAANAAFVGLRGFNETSLTELGRVYHDVSRKKILSNDYLRMAFRALVRRPTTEPSRRLREFFIEHGITPDLRFGDFVNKQVLMVSADINHSARVIYGLKPDDQVLDALLASTALPPWMTPINRDGQLLVDGTIVSNLPIEPALNVRPREIIALDVREWRDIPEEADGFGPLFNRLANTIQKRQFDLEFAVAAAVRVPVKYVHLYADQPVPVYAFERWQELIERGYEQMRVAINLWQVKKKLWWQR
ncbi:MAG: hypothetical protein H6Q37_714 [Chloroflexi bacterium]|nr:hypothetical protein [Chloroflexota bacterium]